MPNYRAVHFATETIVQGWDDLCWITLRTFTGEDHADRGSALVVSLEADLEESRRLAAQEGGRAETDGLTCPHCGLVWENRFGDAAEMEAHTCSTP